MKSDRRAILHLIAIGRLTPAEAERLIVAWNEGREVLLVLFAVIAFAGISQVHTGGLDHAFNVLHSAKVGWLRPMASALTHILGGS